MDRDGREQEFRVGKIIIHPRYNALTPENDFALIKLQRPGAVLNGYVQVVSLPHKRFRFDDEDCVVTGWGAMESGGDASPVRKSAKLSFSCKIAHPPLKRSRVELDLIKRWFSIEKKTSKICRIQLTGTCHTNHKRVDLLDQRV